MRLIALASGINLPEGVTFGGGHEEEGVDEDVAGMLFAGIVSVNRFCNWAFVMGLLDAKVVGFSFSFMISAIKFNSADAEYRMVSASFESDIHRANATIVRNMTIRTGISWRNKASDCTRRS